ncbi:MAG: hypothetical protein ACR2MB_00795 [Acidimicrobiales bacterium]
MPGTQIVVRDRVTPGARRRFQSADIVVRPGRSPVASLARHSSSVAPAAITIEQRDPASETVNDVFVASRAIVALSLAIDPARGAETVRSWDGDHVWN